MRLGGIAENNINVKTYEAEHKCKNKIQHNNKCEEVECKERWGVVEGIKIKHSLRKLIVNRTCELEDFQTKT